jgi:hypothetical protein
MKFVEINQIVIGGTLLAVMEHSLYELLIMSINRNHTKRNPGREGGGGTLGVRKDHSQKEQSYSTPHWIKMAGYRQTVWCDDSCKTTQHVKFTLTAFQLTVGGEILSGADS